MATHDQDASPVVRAETAVAVTEEPPAPVDSNASMTDQSPLMDNQESIDAAGSNSQPEDPEVAATTQAEPERPVTPPRPETPQEIKDLRAAIEAARARNAAKKAELADAQVALNSKRSKSDINAEIATTQKAIATEENSIKELELRKTTAESTLENARKIAARLMRLEKYAQRVSEWIDNEFSKSVASDAQKARAKCDAQLLEELQYLKTNRDRELAKVGAMIAERKENSALLHGPATTNSPQRNESSHHQDPEEAPMTPRTSRALNTSRRGVSSSPGTSRAGAHIEPLPPQPNPAEIAQWDLEDYTAMNSETRKELHAIKSLKKQLQDERQELTRKMQVMRRRIEREIQELTYNQKHQAHTLLAKRKRVLELSTANASLASSLQYAHASLKMTWTKPVEDYFIAQDNTKQVAHN